MFPKLHMKNVKKLFGWLFTSPGGLFVASAIVIETISWPSGIISYYLLGALAGVFFYSMAQEHKHGHEIALGRRVLEKQGAERKIKQERIREANENKQRKQDQKQWGGSK